MDRVRYSALAHASCPFAAPVHAGTFADVVEELALPPGARVLDLGCGKAELAARIAERWGAHCVGVERSPYAIAAARTRAATLSRGSLTIVEGDLAGPLPPGPWHVILNVGAMPPGSQAEALRAWARDLAPDGRIVVGDGYWKSAPTPDYLAALGATEADMADLYGTLARGGAAGLRAVAAHVSPDADFEAYEVAYRDNALAWAATHPADPDAPAAAARARDWWAIYARWGRDTLGFVVTVFAPDHALPPRLR